MYSIFIYKSLLTDDTVLKLMRKHKFRWGVIFVFLNYVANVKNPFSVKNVVHLLVVDSLYQLIALLIFFTLVGNPKLEMFLGDSSFKTKPSNSQYCWSLK